jgi:leucine dehydrogenase
MRITELDPGSEHELVLLAEEPAAGYRAFVAIHSTRLGPAVGGTRLWAYPSDEAAINDALRLARGMSYKNAIAGLPLGGGKSVILSSAGAASREQLFRTHGRLVEALAGRYITAEDVGTSSEDMKIVRTETRFVAGLTDPSPMTARGVFRALQAAARHRWDSDRLDGRTVALQGCGHVGFQLAGELTRAGARLVVCDTDPQRAARCAAEYDAAHVAPEAILGVEADVYAPCALGATLNEETIPLLACQLVVGAANNQLREPADAVRLADRGILYAPDYIANAGGVLDGAREICGWSAERTRAAVDGIYDTMRKLLLRADAAGITAAAAADQLAESRLATAARHG